MMDSVLCLNSIGGYPVMELIRGLHNVYRIMYHFVWIPKYRHKVFVEPYRTKLKGIIIKSAYDHDMIVEELEILKNHLHMVLRAEPKISPSEIIQIIKSISAREFFKMYPEVKEKYFWGGRLWTSSYFVETVGNRDESRVKEYVRNQLKEMDAEEKKFKQLRLFDGS